MTLYLPICQLPFVAVVLGHVQGSSRGTGGNCARREGALGLSIWPAQRAQEHRHSIFIQFGTVFPDDLTIIGLWTKKIFFILSAFPLWL